MTNQATTPPDFTEQYVTPEQIVLGTARLDSHFRKWLVEQLTSMGDSRLRWEPSPRYVADFTEQARQMVQSIFTYGAHNELREYKQLVAAIASFAAEAATQGQAAMAGRVVEAIREWEGHQRTAANNTSYLDGYREKMAEHADAADEIRSIVESLSPLPDYLNRVRNEAATAALEQGRKWLPIETAPKTGERILLGHGNSVWEDEWWSPEINWLECVEGGRHEGEVPSHWMPLPLPPIAVIGDDSEHGNRD